MWMQQRLGVRGLDDRGYYPSRHALDRLLPIRLVARPLHHADPNVRPLQL